MVGGLWLMVGGLWLMVGGLWSVAGRWAVVLYYSRVALFSPDYSQQMRQTVMVKVNK